MPDPPFSPPPRLPVPLELRACLLERASSSPAIRLPHHSSIASISPMTVLFDFLSASSNGRNTGSPRVVVQSLQMLDSHHGARVIAAHLIAPISASDLAVRRTSSSLVFPRATFLVFFSVFFDIGFFEPRLLLVILSHYPMLDFVLVGLYRSE